MTTPKYLYTLHQRSGTPADVVVVRGRYYVNNAELANLTALREYAAKWGAVLSRRDNPDYVPRRRKTRAAVAVAPTGRNTPAELARMMRL